MSRSSYEDLRLRLIDEASRVYFDARLNYLSDERLSTFYRRIRSVGMAYRFRDLDRIREESGVSAWIVWGDDDAALYNSMVISDSPYSYEGTCPGPFACTTCANPPLNVLNPQDAIGLVRSRRCAILTNTVTYRRDRDFLGAIPSDAILVVEDHLVGRCGWQYFDFFGPERDEVFVDGGCMDGATSVAFAEWCGGDYSHIYAFEPNPRSFEECRNGLSAFGGAVTLFESALSDKVGEVHFESERRSKWDARIDESGSTIVHCTTLDKVLRGRRVTLIKLDIEGAELQALQGAREIIAKQRPKLAISVYHTANDLFAIMELLCGLAPYSFAIRHYHSDSIETILYAY